jgi:hypothetical protein
MTTRPSVTFTIVSTEDGEFITVFAPGRTPLPADQTHPNFAKIKDACLRSLTGEYVDPNGIADLFDVTETVTRQFAQLTDRVAVRDGVITLDGDPVHGTLQDQILDFLDNDQDFGPLVAFYEKLATNPLGDVTQGLYDWIVGQKVNGALTITEDGDVIGYKSVATRAPEWRTDEQVVYVPSRRGEGIVNGREVTSSQFIEQVPGDVVEMPRSRVLHAPSQLCGDGLHIGTWDYASNFYGGDSVLLVKFNPRDIVSVPDNNAGWKLRVCRYTIIDTVTEPLEVPVYQTHVDPPEDEDFDDFPVDPFEDDEDEDDMIFSDEDESDEVVAGLKVGDREYHGFPVGAVVLCHNVRAVVVEAGPVEAKFGQFFNVENDVPVRQENGELNGYHHSYVKLADDSGESTPAVEDSTSAPHGKGGPTSYAAKGRGRNPAQDPTTGQFVAGRPGSKRNPKTGRFGS